MNKLNFQFAFALALASSPMVTTLSAQSTEKKSHHHEKWEIGVFGGLSQGQNDIQDVDTKEQNLAYGGLIRYHLNDNLALRANILRGELTAADANYTNRGNRNFTFSSPVTEGSLVGELDILGRSRYKGGSFHRILSPYVFAGAGYALTDPTTDYSVAGKSAAELALINQDIANGSPTGHIVFPIGVGLKFDISQKFALNLEAGSRRLLGDDMDGVSVSGNPDKNDAYSFIGAMLTYRFNVLNDRDHDGIPDEKDACPDAKGTTEMMGCPDADGDGVTDKNDACPDAKGPHSLGGCPDKDGDGVADRTDECPDVKGLSVFNGCPDRDSDGVADKNDSCPDVKGLPAMQGCPDTDGDGITDASDMCPNEKGIPENKGCPAIADRDKDGIADKDDACPDIPGTAKFNGCVDTDGDGVDDSKDKCPKIVGLAKNQGCPEIKEADKKILEAAVYGVVFDSGKSTFKSESYAILNKVADVMKRYPEYSLTISGHTDNAGDAKVNQKLSEARAKACYDYLVTKGVTAARMSHNGFGETSPVGDNTTAAGKAKNRRVAFELLVK